mgnify:FL=1
MKPWQIVAHRGIPDLAPENTLPAFQRALELGADAVELDVRLTADSVPVGEIFFKRRSERFANRMVRKTIR